MADSESKTPFKIFRALSIFTLVLAALLFILALFNPHEVMINVFGYRHKEVSMYFVVLWSFLAGGVYVAVLWISYAIQCIMKIKSLKKKIQELTEKLNPTGL